VLLIAIAVTVFAVTRKEPTAQYVGEKKTKDLVCTKCQAHIEMPVADYDKALKEAPTRENTAASEGEGPRPRSAAILPKLLKCPKCGEQTLLAALKCPKSDTWYPVIEADGKRGKCPD
jgi:hypothetical protein